MKHKLYIAAAILGGALLLIFVDRKTGVFSKLYDSTVGKLTAATKTGA